MALVVDTTKSYRNIPNGQNFTFSLSKPLNQLTAADLQSADPWVGFTCCSINQIYEGKGGEGIPENNPNYCNLWGTDPSWWFDQTNWASVHWSYPANQPHGVYMRNVYVNRDLNAGDYTVANTTARIVLEITPDENTTIQKLCMIDNSNYLHAEYDTSSYDSQMSDYTYISPAVLLVVNNCVYLINQNIERFFVPDNIGFYIDSTTNQGYRRYFPSFENLDYHKLGMGWTMGYHTGSIEDNCVKTGTGQAPVYTYNDVDFNGHTGILQLNGSGSNYHIRVDCTMSANADDSDFSLIHRAYSGVRYRVNETWYKPIIEGGIVTGYSDDMTVPSEWDTWTKASGHNVPSGPPTPPPGPLESDEQVTGGAYGSGGFVKMYACKKSELKALQKWMSGGPAGPGGTDPTTIPENFNPIEQFIGITGFPIEIPTGTYDTTTFKFRAADNTTINTGINTKTTLTGTQKYMTKSLDIPTWEKNDNAVPWMDYSATVECYVPYCGVVGLDPQVVMGHSIRIQMWVDFVSGDCSAFVECNTDKWHPVAYVGGNLGCAEAMTAAAYGQLMGARAAGAHQMTQAVIGGVKNLVTGTINTATANYARGAGNYNLPVPRGQSGFLANQISNAGGIMTSGYSAMAAITNAVNLGVSLTQQNLDNRYNYTVAKNSLGTTIAGSFGSQSSWHYPIMPYVKVTWPTPMSKDVTNYGKTYGVPVHKTGNLKDYHGYTICNNVDTSGISTATAEEQSMIKQYLESGVYLP